MTWVTENAVVVAVWFILRLPSPALRYRRCGFYSSSLMHQEFYLVDTCGDAKTSPLFPHTRRGRIVSSMFLSPPSKWTF